jgi:hypothetical protein
MKKNFVLSFILVIFVILGAGCKEQSSRNTSLQNSTVTSTVNSGNEPSRSDDRRGQIKDPMISEPQENAVVKSPTTVSGQAPGTWFSEGQFSALITDKDEKELGRGVMRAQKDWMTEDMVPFSGSISFVNNAKVSSGFIIFQKDNPSGKLENERRYRISVLFDRAHMDACTEEYMPVCGETEVQCIMAPCPPLKQTYGNRCEAERVGAKNIVTGECQGDKKN